jgi:MFS family permease
MDFRPFRHPNFRRLYLGQFVSTFGTQITTVALPYQVYMVSKSPVAVGAIGVAQLVPLLVTALLGGEIADRSDRRKIMFWSEAGLLLCCAILVANTVLWEPKLWVLFAMAVCMSALNGIHRPAMDALVPRLVGPEDQAAVAALGSLRWSVGAIAGPALGGVLIAKFGVTWTFLIDGLTYLFAMVMVARLNNPPRPPKPTTQISVSSMLEGFRYGVSRPHLLGTYGVDMVAMIFAMPIALFPILSDSLGGPARLGWLYAAMAVGALLVALGSGWTKKVTRHGAAVSISASIWGLAIIGFGLSTSFEWSVFWLVAAGAADAVSVIFRSTIWNQTIPDAIRGRMAGVEMLSYLSGPMLGQLYSGTVAALIGARNTSVLGGTLSFAAIAIVTALLPRYWKYQGDPGKIGP